MLVIKHVDKCLLCRIVVRNCWFKSWHVIYKSSVTILIIVKMAKCAKDEVKDPGRLLSPRFSKSAPKLWNALPILYMYTFYSIAIIDVILLFYYFFYY